MAAEPRAGERQVLIGEMCPGAADGRPAVRPLFRRTADAWTDRADEVAAPVERSGVRQFSVLGWEGKRAGLFSVAGAAQLADGVAVIGAYAGRSPCDKPRGAGGAVGLREPECVAALRDCGLAVAALEPAGGFKARPVGEDPDPIELDVGGACVADGMLLVDIDGDGAAEAFPAQGLVDPSGALASELTSVAAGNASCTARFATRSAFANQGAQLLGGLDILAVADFDADGRDEIVVSFRLRGRRMWALYGATATAGRLDLVAQASPWPF